MNGLIIYLLGLGTGLFIFSDHPFLGFSLAMVGAAWAGMHDVAVRNLVRSRSKKW